MGLRAKRKRRLLILCLSFVTAILLIAALNFSAGSRRETGSVRPAKGSFDDRHRGASVASNEDAPEELVPD